MLFKLKWGEKMNCVKDGIFGLVVGDALGLPYVWYHKEELEKDPITGMGSFGFHQMPKGTWSDDSSLTLALMASIVKNRVVNCEAIMKEFSRWYFLGEYTQYGQSFDYGKTTMNSIINYAKGIPPLKCGGTGERDNGNGSLMRILPLAFLPDHLYSLELVEKVSALTHAHPRSRIACSIYTEIARNIINNGDSSFQDHIDIASETVNDYYRGNDQLDYYKRVMNNDYGDGIKSSGYVVDTLECACYSICETESLKEALLFAVNLGEDSDTVGAVCGGLAGLYYGRENIPKEWIRDIPKFSYVERLCGEFEEFIAV